MNGGGLLSSLLSSSASRPIWKCITSMPIKSDCAVSWSIHNTTTAPRRRFANSGFDAARERGNCTDALFTATFSCDEDSVEQRPVYIDRSLISYFICKLRLYIKPQCWNDARECVNCFWLASRQIFAKCLYNNQSNANVCVTPLKFMKIAWTGIFARWRDKRWECRDGFEVNSRVDDNNYSR